MINSENKNGLKGQYNLAQVNPPTGGVALGFSKRWKIVRAISFMKEKFLFRTKRWSIVSWKMIPCNSVRKKLIALFIEFARTVFFLFPLPQALPGARISWPFRPKLVYEEVPRKVEAFGGADSKCPNF